MTVVVAIAAVALAASPVAPQLPPPRADELVSAARAGDPARVMAVASRAGARRLAGWLKTAGPPRRAALVAAELVAAEGEPGAWWPLLPVLASLAGTADRSVAVPAARALATLAPAVVADAERHDVPPEELAAVAARCDGVARARGFADVRVWALECAKALGAPTAAALTGDPDPEVSRAAHDLL